MNVKTNIGKTFFKLLQKHFLPTHPLYTIFNKNMIKINYICFPNMGSIISSHNKHILNSSSTEYGCNCNDRHKCPLENKCLTPRIVYRADVTNNKTDEHKCYWYLKYSIQRSSWKFIKHLSDIDHIWPLQMCLSITGN